MPADWIIHAMNMYFFSNRERIPVSEMGNIFDTLQKKIVI
jgi:hypothetical protein